MTVSVKIEIKDYMYSGITRVIVALRSVPDSRGVSYLGKTTPPSISAINT